jgi:hypothetical protein
MSVRRSQISTSGPNSNSKKASQKGRRPRRGGQGRNLLNGLIEPLEGRLLFNTVITDTDPLTATPATVSFTYKDLAGQSVRVTVHGDVTAEFVFARVTKGADNSPAGWNNVILGEPVAAGSKEDGRDLFHVYVAQASIDSYIAIAKIPDPTQTGAHPMQPFSGNITITTQPLRGTDLAKSTAQNTGSIYLGTRTRAVPMVDNSGNIPVRSAHFNGQGVFPVTPGNKLVAGLTTAPGVSLGKFMFGGTVSGEVKIDGSMETFYCGALLTGVTEGQSQESTPDDPGNFYVGGDIRNVLVKGSIGTDGLAKTLAGRSEPTYMSGVDFDVKGRVGQIRTGADYAAWAKVENTNKGLGLRTRQQEIEFREDPAANRGDFTDFENGQFGDSQDFFNDDTFANAQFLGSINSKQTGNNSVQVNGLIQSFTNVNDISDYYAVPLMAGQTVTVRLISPVQTTQIVTVKGKQKVVTTETKSVLHAGVFDPDDRLIATDYSNTSDITSQSVDTDPNQQQLFSFTAQKPGIYRFAVAHDPQFGNTGDRLGEFTYQLQLTGIGNLAIGGLVAAGTIFAGEAATTLGSAAFQVANIQTVLGDLGAIYSINDYITSFAEAGINALAQGGDLRAFDAMSIGSVAGNAGGAANTFTIVNDGGNVLALTGSVGMIRARGTDRGNTIAQINEGAPQRGLPAIGGNIQYIIVPSNLNTDLAANGNIGVVQVGQFGLNYAGSLSADADAKGPPGKIDLIDVTQDLGEIGTGGPVISAGPGGDVGYIHVATGHTAFRPSIFGGNDPEETTYVKGQSAAFTDDSGANVNITPTQDTIFDPTTGTVTDNSGTLTVLTYPIAQSLTNPLGTGGGGVAIVRVTSTRGVLITSDGPTQIGDIISQGSGPALIVDPGPDRIPGTADDNVGPDGVANSGDETFVLDPTSTVGDNSITLKSSNGKKGVINVWNISGNNFNFIKNQTTGDLVNAQIGQTDTVQANNIGLAHSNVNPSLLVQGSTVADLAGTSQTEGNVFPYLDTRDAFTINGGGEASPAVLNLQALQAIGNVMINGIAQKIQANADRVNVKGVYEGIVGAILAQGQLRYVDVGEGLLPSGSGNMGAAGIYAVSATGGANLAGRVIKVVASNGDIRGNIAANIGIGEVDVINGSIINSNIWIHEAAAPALGTGADLVGTTEFGAAGFIPHTGGNDLGTLGNIDQIVVTGNGGIIGLNAVANNIGPITVTGGGFGIMNSQFRTLGSGRVGTLTADGYGIRGVNIRGGQSVDGLVATGTGKKLSTATFSPSVRLGETNTIDPFFGTRPNGLTDLNSVLGTTAASPVRKGTSTAGLIDFATVGVSRDLGTFRAFEARLDTLNVPNLLNHFETTDYVDSVKVVTGRSPVIAVGKDALRFQVDVAGDAPLISIGGTLKGSSGIRVQGKAGTLTTGGSLFGDIYALGGFSSVRIGGNYGSQGSRTPNSIGTFATNGHLLTGSKFTVGKDVTNLIIGGDVEDGAEFDIGGTLTHKKVVGNEIGDINVGTG